MSIFPPARGPLTDALLDYLERKFADLNVTILIGDAIKPVGAGWPGTPQDGTFASYVTVGTGRATMPRDEPPQLSGQGTAWECAYTLLSVGASRQQADYTSDWSRIATVLFPGNEEALTLGAEDWKVQSVRFNALGSVDKNETTDPPYWQVSDTAIIRITRATKRVNR